MKSQTVTVMSTKTMQLGFNIPINQSTHISNHGEFRYISLSLAAAGNQVKYQTMQDAVAGCGDPSEKWLYFTRTLQELISKDTLVSVISAALIKTLTIAFALCSSAFENMLKMPGMK